METIQCFEGKYDKAIFYSKMGRFFAEERYIRQMPYLRNESDRIWFLIERNGMVVAFSSLRIMDEYILFTTEYVEPGYRKQGLFKALTAARFAYCEELNMPIRTSTALEYIKNYYLEQGFEIYRTTRNFWFLLRRSDKELAPAYGRKYTIIRS
ncbi:MULTISPECIES: GNAT family N-acetyltransferase [unclassified Paenibacillus]|uniref:GNAT family N-acetyltransferase n=1 Tax=unclassified Paenibacillus TaxID=185978 RepID=UPI0008399F2B|nr:MULTISPECIES: GNAT family N-acetyltransferase [unclassified Paenibacillus]NWL89125.1 N-acetyltransferase [Paenibacillus sp. 79R4]